MDLNANANVKGGWGCVGYAIGISIFLFAVIGGLILIAVMAKLGF